MADILVVDDEDLARFTLREILESSGHQVREAANGAEALEHVHKALPNLIITDIIMPEKEGIETIVAIKRDHPKLKIIAISGGGRTRNLDFLKLAERFGADAILAKPFSEDELMDKVNALLP